MVSTVYRMKEAMFYRKRCIIIFVLLALAFFVYLLYNLNLQEEFQIEFLPTIEPSVPSLKSRNPNQCFQGQEPTPEEAEEERVLLDSIAWPEPSHLSTALPPFSETSDPNHSWFTIRPAEGGRERHVGDQLEAMIRMFDFQGRPKHYGGDFIIARLHNPDLVAGVAGQVVDHLNGSYSAFFPLLWEGRALVSVMLVHSSEAVTLLSRVTRDQPHRIFFKSLFRSGSRSESTFCNVCLPSNQKLCNFSDIRTGDPWYCYKPKSLSCDTRSTHAKGGYKENLKPNEVQLLRGGVNMKVYIPASGSDGVDVLPEKNKLQAPNSNSTPLENKKFMPSGYYLHGVWKALGGLVVHQFNGSSAMSECLKDKVVHIYGDSTARQWFEYFNEILPDLHQMNIGSDKQSGPLMSVDTSRNLVIKYRSHGPPIRFANVPVSQLRYLANEVEGMTGGANTVVVLSIWSHFSTFPIELYIRRLRHIRAAVVRLLNRSPGTVVVIRTANLKALFSLYETLTNSDWFSLQRDKVLRAMFKGLRVHLLDAWDMSLAHDLPHSLHSQPPIIKNMINVLLSHICPKTKIKG